MKKGLTIIIAVCFMILMFGGSSFALPLSGKIWTITNYGTNAGQSEGAIAITPGTTPLALFQVNAINFDSRNFAGSATYNQFLSNALTGAPGPNGLVWGTLAAGFDKDGSIATNATTTSFFQFTGNTFFSSTFTILHDDGIFLTIDGHNITAFETPTTPELATINLASIGLAEGYHDFTLNYAAWNGYPEVLTLKTPEPMTLLLLGLGMLGVAGIGRKFRS
jgi:hypothetical protein